MIQLRKLLSDSCKARRHRRNHLNIQITVLTWFIEFLGFAVFLLGSFIIGHTNTTTTFILQTFSTMFSFIILPSILSMSNPTFKGVIADSIWYQKLMDRISPTPKDEDVVEEEDEDEPRVRGEAVPQNVVEEEYEDEPGARGEVVQH